MNPILCTESLEVLARFARGARALLALDFDGTLAPIVEDRDAAVMRASTRELLTEVCRSFRTAIISGRSRDDVSARVEGVGVAHVIGNHGLEPAVGMDRFEPMVRTMKSHLEMALRPCSGIALEDKRYSLAVHYRQSTDPREACSTILAALGAMGIGHRIVRGKAVINVLPEGAPDKGLALRALQKREAADAAIFVGDDWTDEDVFQIDDPASLLAIRVGRSPSSQARYYLQDQAEIDTLLRWLLRFAHE